MTLLLSRSEIKSETEKALRGAGIDWGRAKDGGIMAAWLAAHDQDFLGTLLHALEYIPAPPTDSAICAPTDGMILAESLLATDQDWSGHIIGPRFMIAAMGIVTSEQNGGITLRDKTSIFAYAHQGDIWVAKIFEGHDALLTLSTTPASDSDKNFQKLGPSKEAAYKAPLADWQRLGVYAHRVYVKETEEKRRAGAGAGDIDNS